MEKIININFQGRIIPIEERTYERLKQYVSGLRNHFAGEESSEEIINDIENRIAELFSERLKRGVNCIVDSDLDDVINSIGRLEDIEAAEGVENKSNESKTTFTETPPLKGRFYRNADDKVIAGVCSGIASRIGIDPIVVRIIFVLLFGALCWIYILMWIIVPSQSINSNITRRLYRNPDNKVIAGVCSGLAIYFKTEVWIPRLIFTAPLIMSALWGGTHVFWPTWSFAPHIFAGSIGSSLFLIYIILWIALPYANSATDRLEMRGEKIDIYSIKAATQAQAGMNAAPQRHTGSGLGRVIGILFKAFFLFIAGIAGLSLFGVLIGLIFAGFAAAPFSDFLFNGSSEYALFWSGVLLLVGIPLLAFFVWGIRRLSGFRSHRHYLGYIFSGLWLIGIISVIILAVGLAKELSTQSAVEETFSLIQPSHGKLFINVNDMRTDINAIHHWSRHRNDDDMPFHIVNKDSLWLNTVKVNVVQSADSFYHIYENKISRGKSSADAKLLAAHIEFSIDQHDSIINLPRGFAISNKDKFHNQRVEIIVEVPCGKEIEFSKSITRYKWFDIDKQNNSEFEYNWNSSRHYSVNSYFMTTNGLKDKADTTRCDQNDEDNDNEDSSDN